MEEQEIIDLEEIGIFETIEEEQFVQGIHNEEQSELHVVLT